MKFPATHLIFFLKNLKHISINSLHSERKKLDLITASLWLKKKFNNNKFEENSKKYKQQRNYCVKLLRKTKMEYFQNMDVNKVNDNKMFWKTVKARFLKKCKTANTIILTEGDMIIKNEKFIADTFNDYCLFGITDYFKNNESVIKMTTGTALPTHRTVARWETFTIVGSSLLHAVI